MTLKKPIYFDGKYHYFYLYNRDYPKGNGTEWRHAVSDDLVHWTDEGVAIPKYTNPDGDIWTGSVVVDKENTAGFGKNALVAIVTQPSAKDKNRNNICGTAQTKENHSNSTVATPLCLIRAQTILEIRK